MKSMVRELDIAWKRRGIIVGTAVGVYAGYRYLLPVAAPFLAAWILAAWIYPAAVKIEKKTRIKKTLAGTLLLSLIFIGGGVVLYLGISEILRQIRTAVTHFAVLKSWCSALLKDCCKMLEEVTGIAAADSRRYILTHMEGMENSVFSAVSSRGIGKVLACAKNILVLLSGLVVTFISAVLIMGDMENIRKKIWDYSWLVGTRRVVRRLKKTTITYLKAQIVIMALVAAVCAAGFWLMKSPYFLLLGIALGALDALPLIGTGTFLYPAAAVFLLKGRSAVAVGCVLLDIVTSILREFLEPRLLGGKLGISPMMIVVSVYAGVFLYGGWGVLLGPLAFSTIYEIGKEWDVWD